MNTIYIDYKKRMQEKMFLDREYINPQTTIAGYPILKIRKFLKLFSPLSVIKISDAEAFIVKTNMSALSDEDFYNLKVTRELKKKSVREARIFLANLEQQDYLKGIQDRHERVWKTTLKADSLSLSLIGKPLSRQHASKKIENFLTRIRELKESSQFSYRVKKAIVFGCYLSADKPAIGSIDIAVEMERKKLSNKRHMIVENKKAKKAKGKFTSFLYKYPYDYGFNEAVAFLFGKQRFIRPFILDSIVRNKRKTKVIYLEGKIADVK